MTDNLSLRALALPAKDADTFNAYLRLPFEPIALEGRALHPLHS